MGEGALRRGRREWYERELGWATAGGRPPSLRTGVRFDVLDVPLAAGLAVLRRFPGTGPAAAAAGRALLLVAAGGAEEVPGLLDWLDWRGIDLDLVLRGPGGRIPAPAIPRPPRRTAPGAGVTGGAAAAGVAGTGEGARGGAGGGGTGAGWRPPPGLGRSAGRAPGYGAGGAAGGAGAGAAAVPGTRNRAGHTAVWLRPPVPGREVEPTLPSMTVTGSGSRADVVGLVRLIGAVATECHRSRIHPAATDRPVGDRPRVRQPCSFS